MTARAAGRRAVLVIGGGASGVILAAHLLRDPATDIRVTIIEKRAELGQGVAYSTQLADHILNVSALGMSAFADDPEHFFRWLVAQGLADAQTPRTYVSRRIYGRYLAEILDEMLIREKDTGRLHTVNDVCLGLVPTASGVEARLANGTSLIGHVGVLAVGHEEQAIAGRGLAVRPGSPEDVPLDPEQPILILGTGLSMIDTWLTLENAGHRGRIVALSRRGLVPAVHQAGRPIRLDAADVPLGTDLSYFIHWFRGLIRSTERAGGDWRDVVDGLRPFNQMIWQSWSKAARRRFVEHTRAWWDIHRHRMPPLLHERVMAAVDAGRIELVAGRLLDATSTEAGLRATIRPRGESAAVVLDVGRLYDCTGITTDLSDSSNPLIRSLIDRGLARPDPMRIGLDVKADCSIVDRDGVVTDRLFAIGPLTRGTFFEIDAVPDIRQQCATLARMLVHQEPRAASPGV